MNINENKVNLNDQFDEDGIEDILEYFGEINTSDEFLMTNLFEELRFLSTKKLVLKEKDKDALKLMTRLSIKHSEVNEYYERLAILLPFQKECNF